MELRPKDGSILAKSSSSASVTSSEAPNRSLSESGTLPEGGSASPAYQKKNYFERFANRMPFWREGKVEAEFPPAHWKVHEIEAMISGRDAGELPGTSFPVLIEAQNADEVSRALEGTPEAQAPDPVSFANRIKSMIASSNFSFASSSKPGDGPVEETTNDQNSKFLQFLSSPFVMNGSAQEGRQSVWSALERLKGKIPVFTEDRSKESQKDPSLGTVDKGKAKEETATDGTSDDDDSSLMLYGPLVPDANSQVELAESEVVREGPKDRSAIDPTATEKKTRFPNVWPLSLHKTGESGKDAEKEDSEGRVYVRRHKDARVWIPSDTKISLEIMWWGYRIYLPPPVLNTLDNKQLEGAKRAAMVTAALKWLLGHVPVAMVPPNVRPALTLLKVLVPYLGYIGGFVAWGWGGIKTLDKGHGVTLTATWLVIFALVPGTWDRQEPLTSSTETTQTDDQNKTGDSEQGASGPVEEPILSNSS